MGFASIGVDQLTLLNEPAVDGSHQDRVSGSSFSGPVDATDARGDGLEPLFHGSAQGLADSAQGPRECEVARFTHTSLEFWTQLEEGGLMIIVGAQTPVRRCFKLGDVSACRSSARDSVVLAPRRVASSFGCAAPASRGGQHNVRERC